MKNKGELVLLFSLNKNQLSDLKYITMKMKLRAKIIKKEDYNQSIGFLCNNPQYGKIDEVYTEGDIEKPMIVLKGFEKDRFDEFFDTIKKACTDNDNIIKAMVTDTNKSWSAKKLFDEIYKEHKLTHNI